MNAHEATKLVTRLASAFPRTPMDEMTITTYAENLIDLTAQIGAEVVAVLIRTSKWLPTVAEIRAAAVEVAAADEFPSAEEAWEEVTQNLSYYHEPHFSTDLIGRAVRCLGGVKVLAIMPYEKLAFERNRFLEIYARFRERAVNDLRAGYVALPGCDPEAALFGDGNEVKALLDHVGKSFSSRPH